MAISAEGKFTFADVWQGGVFVCRRAIVINSVLGLVLIVSAGLLRRLSPEGSWLQWFMFGYGIFALIYFWILILYRSNKTSRQSPNLQGVVKYSFGDNGYLLETAHTRAEIKWSAMVKWRENKHILLLYSHPRVGSLVPKRFFQNAAEVGAVRELLQANVKKA